jgi:hypothetical protein
MKKIALYNDCITRFYEHLLKVSLEYDMFVVDKYHQARRNLTDLRECTIIYLDDEWSN